MTDAHVGDGGQRRILDIHWRASRRRRVPSQLAHGRLLITWLILHVPRWIPSLYNGAPFVQHAFERMTTNGGIATIVHYLNSIFSLPEPYNTTLCTFASGCPTALRRRTYSDLPAISDLEIIEVAAIPATDRTASQRNSGFWITRSGSKYCCTPRPSRSGRLPPGC